MTSNTSDFDKLVESGIENALKNCMGLKNEESVLIVTDHGMGDVGGLFFKKAIELGGQAMIMDIPAPKVDGEEPLEQVAKAMERVDVALLITSRSLSHTQARKNATEAGTRIASMPEIDRDSIARTLNADYENIRKKARALIEVMRKKRKISVKTEAGTDIEFLIGGREIHGYNSGLYVTTGAWGNLPDGEVYFAPVEKKAEGKIVIDASMVELGLIDEPITIHVKAGFATKITGGAQAEKISESLRQLGRSAHNIAEFGIGLNDKAKLTENVLEAEKVLGTAHIALGTNITFGGTVQASCHMDGVFNNPSIWADDFQIMDKGKFLVDFEKVLNIEVIK